MGIHSLKTIDTLDDRREIYFLLDKLLVREQEWFLSELGRNVEKIPFTVTNNSRTTNEAYLDLLSIMGQYELKIQPVLSALEKFVAGRTAMTFTQRLEN